MSRRRGATRSDGRRDNGAASVVDLALDGLTASEIAARLGIHRSTVWRQLTDPTNAARLAHVTARRIAAQGQRLAHLGEQALDVVEQLLADEAAPPAVRLRAAQLVLERTLPATIQADIRPAQGVDVGPLLRRLMEPMAIPTNPTSAPPSTASTASTASTSAPSSTASTMKQAEQGRAPEGRAGALNGQTVAAPSPQSSTWRLPNPRGEPARPPWDER